MNVRKKRVQIVFAPDREECISSDVYLPRIHTLSGWLYHIEDFDASFYNGQGIISTSHICSLQEEFSRLINRPCVIGSESSCLYFVSDDDAVYEVCMFGMFSAIRRFLKEILPNGKYGDVLHDVIGVAFYPDC